MLLPANRLFSEMINQMNQAGWDRPSQRSNVTIPALNVWESEEGFHVEVDLPGFTGENIQVSVEEGTQLVISGERKAPEFANNVTWHRQERPFGTFSRTLTLPVMVDSQRVEAKVENGVLAIFLPKVEAVKPRKIVVKTN